ncbi:MAG: iron-containing alcohol dehydrogenase, partial [Gammaproteobacteria bacterium]|nr:iron-containing alcohol dehydrogenase [Gammaproteobacteria bacterium]
GGLALANAGLGLVHGLAAPIGGAFPAPHGAVCAALLPHGVAANLKALGRRRPVHPVLERFRTVARLLTGNPAAEPQDGVDALRQLVRSLGIPPLRTYGIGPEHFAALARGAAAASSMKANPIPLETDEILELLHAAT